MVEVFKTNVKKDAEAKLLVKELAEHFPNWKINFDLEDCDKVLRVEGKQIQPNRIINIVEKHSYQCTVLE